MLAGGRSSRFGSDKLAARYQGAPLLHHAVLRLAEVCREVLVVIPPDGPEPALPVAVPARVVRDPAEGEGPLRGVLTGLGHAETQWGLVAGGDMPELRTAVLIEMLRVGGEATVDAVALQDGVAFRPLPCLLRTAEAREASHALLHEGERSLRALLDALRLAVIDEPTWTALDPGRRTLFDVDAPADLEDAAEDG